MSDTSTQDPRSAADDAGLEQPRMVECHACERQVPEGEFCGVCGAHLSHATPRGVQRRHAYAANPAQHVFNPAVISTLLPHLPHRRSAPFRIGLAITVLGLILLGLLQLAGPAIALAALAVPALYLVYLYEVEVYESEPWLVVGLTFVGGAVLGGLYAWIIGAEITREQVLSAFFGPTPQRVLLLGAVPPMGSQLLMLIFPVVLYLFRRKRFDEALDGFTFGATAGLGFTLALTLVELWPELSIGPISRVAPFDNAIDILVRGALLPIVNASTTGLICAALWLLNGRRRAEVHHVLASLPITAVVALVAQGVLGAAALILIQPWELLVLYLVVAAILIVLVRIALHSMLLAEAVDVTVGPPFPCSHCHHLVPRMAFCPNCGVATRATPKSGGGRHHREVR
jgi:RsiW-degrading membrane proteinase PrsW (M82 family)/RNA polymerase subunit RPABC4/transcription elongation factor Spt4